MYWSLLTLLFKLLLKSQSCKLTNGKPKATTKLKGPLYIHPGRKISLNSWINMQMSHSAAQVQNSHTWKPMEVFYYCGKSLHFCNISQKVFWIKSALPCILAFGAMLWIERIYSSNKCTHVCEWTIYREWYCLGSLGICNLMSWFRNRNVLVISAHNMHTWNCDLLHFKCSLYTDCWQKLHFVWTFCAKSICVFLEIEQSIIKLQWSCN